MRLFPWDDQILEGILGKVIFQNHGVFFMAKTDKYTFVTIISAMSRRKLRFFCYGKRQLGYKWQNTKANAFSTKCQ